MNQKIKWVILPVDKNDTDDDPSEHEIFFSFMWPFIVLPMVGGIITNSMLFHIIREDEYGKKAEWPWWAEKEATTIITSITFDATGDGDVDEGSEPFIIINGIMDITKNP